MPLAFTILAPPLHATAEAALGWFVANWGITKSRVEIEQGIDGDMSLRPTFSCVTHDFHTLCIEVSDSLYPNYLDAFVLSCRDKGLPVKLFVAIQKGDHDTGYSQNLKAAKRAGVGILELDGDSGTVIQQPLSLSLAGLRPLDSRKFPPKLRQPLTDADRSFRDGNPPKACAMVYDELESLFRRFAKRIHMRALWPNTPGLNIEKAPWANLITDISTSMHLPPATCPNLTAALLARIHGVTPHRNDSGHKPKNAKALKKRDLELRTRFESAIDLLYDFVVAIKPLKV